MFLFCFFFCRMAAMCLHRRQTDGKVNCVQLISSKRQNLVNESQQRDLLSQCEVFFFFFLVDSGLFGPV